MPIPYAARDVIRKAAEALAAADASPANETSSAEYQQRRGVAWDIIEQAINTYNSWMLDDDFDANRVLKDIIGQMQERRAIYMPHEREAASPASEGDIARVRTALPNEAQIAIAICTVPIDTHTARKPTLYNKEAHAIARAVLALVRGERGE